MTENDLPKGKLFWDLTDEEREEMRRDMEALERLLDNLGVPRLRKKRP
jgi:hypothetical protein